MIDGFRLKPLRLAMIVSAALLLGACDGDDGATGPAGPQGLAGAAGADGAPGAPGADGADGAPGTPGADGADGAPGAPGADGTDGAPGTPGSPATIASQGVANVVGACYNPDLYTVGTTYSVTWNANKAATIANGGTFFGSALYRVTADYEVLGTEIFNGSHAIKVGVAVTTVDGDDNIRLEHGGTFEAYYAVPTFLDQMLGQIRYLGSTIDLGDGFEDWETVHDARIILDGTLGQQYTLLSRKTQTGGNFPGNALAEAVERPKSTSTTYHGILTGVDEILPELVDWPPTPAGLGGTLLPGQFAGGGALPEVMDLCKISANGGHEPVLYAGSRNAQVITIGGIAYDRADHYMFLTADTGLPAYFEHSRLQSGQATFVRYRMLRAYINGVLVHGEEPEEPEDP